ncbi:hypothetical protein HAPAU_00680 [Halalkalicoccus paucihalophilus]|jgi:hypothetical protein|uniref:Uncharacterized protein n=1 Tax=Halalkalicoccus paucihalophilus TaxID=1008153 RepID=A0A151AIJ1_9EURY|nr:hypothetical protein HAPAU_00680 [Halalkalicoccus paucihalophilus]
MESDPRALVAGMILVTVPILSGLPRILNGSSGPILLAGIISAACLAVLFGIAGWWARSA